MDRQRSVHRNPSLEPPRDPSRDHQAKVQSNSAGKTPCVCQDRRNERVRHHPQSMVPPMRQAEVPPDQRQVLCDNRVKNVPRQKLRKAPREEQEEVQPDPLVEWVTREHQRILPPDLQGVNMPRDRQRKRQAVGPQPGGLTARHAREHHLKRNAHVPQGPTY